MGKFQDLTGKRFGRLTVVKRADDYVSPKGRHNTRWLCKCDCGNQTTVVSGDLRSGKVKSCKCLQSEATVLKNKKRATHGLSQSLLYNILHGMNDRCHNKKFKYYFNYGGRGIKVCDEWNKDLIGIEKAIKNFYNWSKQNGYKRGLTIDRIDNDGNYEPNNCRWVTRKVNNNNKRNNYKITFNGKTQDVAQWSEETNISYGCLRRRIAIGWDIKKALTLEPKVGNNKWS